MIPDSVTLIYDKAFQDMSALESAKIGSGFTHIGINAFYRDAKLATVSLGSRVTTIFNDAFYGAGLTTVTSVGGTSGVAKRVAAPV